MKQKPGKIFAGGLLANWRSSISHLESISANETADQDNEPNSGMRTIESALNQLAMNEQIWICFLMLLFHTDLKNRFVSGTKHDDDVGKSSTNHLTLH